jgi:hypothetical protein
MQASHIFTSQADKLRQAIGRELIVGRWACQHPEATLSSHPRGVIAALIGPLLCTRQASLPKLLHGDQSSSHPSPHSVAGLAVSWPFVSVLLCRSPSYCRCVSPSCVSRTFCPVEAFWLAALLLTVAALPAHLFHVYPLLAHFARWDRTYTSNPHA